jgi:sortase (surface protein transpeptidase)
MSNSTERPPRRPAAASVAVALAVAGLVMVGLAFATPATPQPVLSDPSTGPTVSSTPPRPTTSASVRPTPRAAQPDVRDRVTGLLLPESDPVAVSIPRIDVRSTLVRLGLDPEGALEVPRDPARAGWFYRGATPGALGPAVIAGHVTWNGAPAVFHKLGSLRRGDRVTVDRKDGKTAVFTVDRVASFSKSRFPSRAVYGAIDHAGLRLITCGGTYDAARHRYLDNVVVFASLTGVG